jgi:hypothetical protein
LYGTGVVLYDHQPTENMFLRSFYAGHCLQIFLTQPASSINYCLELKPVLCSSHDDVPLNSKRKLGDNIVHQYGSTDRLSLVSTPVKYR